MTANLIFVLIAAVSVAPKVEVSKTATNVHDFARYQIILDRSPFSPPAGSVDTPQPGFSTRFSFIGTAKTNEDAPVVAFIQDKEANNRIYVKAEGETVGAVTIVSISQSPAAKLVMKQGLETATLTLEQKGTVGAAPPPAAAAAPSPNPVMPGQPTPGVPAGVRRIPFRRGD